MLYPRPPTNLTFLTFGTFQAKFSTYFTSKSTQIIQTSLSNYTIISTYEFKSGLFIRSRKLGRDQEKSQSKAPALSCDTNMKFNCTRLSDNRINGRS
jgi:hypothetical protein